MNFWNDVTPDTNTENTPTNTAPEAEGTVSTESSETNTENEDSQTEDQSAGIEYIVEDAQDSQDATATVPTTEETPESLTEDQEVFKANVEFLRLNNLLEDLPEDYEIEYSEEGMKKLFEDVRGDSDPLGYVKRDIPESYHPILDYLYQAGSEADLNSFLQDQYLANAEVDLSTVDSQKSLLAAHYQSRGMSNAEIAGAIASLESEGTLAQRAQAVVQQEKAAAAKENEHRLAVATSERTQREQALIKQYEMFSNYGKEKGTLMGYPTSGKETQSLAQALMVPVDNQGNTAYTLAHEKAMSDPDKALLIAKIVLGDLDLSFTGNKAQNSQVKSFKESLKQIQRNNLHAAQSGNSGIGQRETEDVVFESTPRIVKN